MSWIVSLKMRIKHRFHLFPKISVIVPVYNGEKTVERCIYSILFGNGISTEIICVNDGSVDNTLKVLKKLRYKYGCIRILSHKRNKGLYLARIAGIKRSRGKYLGFVDSDDYVSEGYFEKLYNSIKKNDADIAVGQVVNQARNGCRYIQIRCEKFPYTFDEENKKSVYDLYWEQEGKNYHWHVVWNKLYKRKIWQEQMPLLNMQKKHLVMLEDFIFSTIILSKVQRYSVDVKAQYFYVESESSSINFSGAEKVKKNLWDIKEAFDFVEKFMVDFVEYHKYKKNFEEWKSRYGRLWKRNIDNYEMNLSDMQECKSMLTLIFGKRIDDVVEEDEYCYKLARFINSPAE